MGAWSMSVPEIHTAASNRLGLIVTRLDVKEPSSRTKEYTIVLYPGVSHLPKRLATWRTAPSARHT